MNYWLIWLKCMCSKAFDTAFGNEKNKVCGWRGVYVLAKLLAPLLYYLYCRAAICGVDNTWVCMCV
jgi:hypothetical protein